MCQLIKRVQYIVFLSFFLCCGINVATAQEELYLVDIKEKQLIDVVKELSIIFNKPIAISAQLNTPDIKFTIQGQYSVDEALYHAFNKTPIKYEFSEFGVLILPSSTFQVEELTPPIDEIIVKGIRNSLHYSRELKKSTTEISDVIATEDMGNYPDINIAESLQRIPGITITREAGEGRQLSLRGTSPDFTQVTLNGMPVLANNDSPMDSRVQKQRDRSFDFNVFSSELFNQVQVLKAYSAENISGGIAGTVALETIRPFDQPGFNLSLSSQVGSNEYSSEPASRFTGLVSQTWGNWGAVLSASYGKRYVEEIGANTIRWRKIQLDNIYLSELEENLQDRMLNSDVIIPRGNRYSIWKSSQTRLGATATLQYEAQTASFSFDIIHANLDSLRSEYHLYPRGQQSTPIKDNATRLISAEINDENELVYSAYTDAIVATESRAQDTKTDYNQLVFNSNTMLNDNLEMSVVLGIESSNFDIPLSNKIYTKGQSDVSIDYRSDSFFPDIQYSSDLLLPETWKMQEIDLEEYAATSQYKHLATSFNYTYSSNFSSEIGFQITEFSNTSTSLYQEDLLIDNWAAYEEGIPNGNLNENGYISIDNTIPTDFTQSTLEHHRANWLTLNTNAAIQHFGIDPFILTNNNQVIERLQSSIEESKHSGFIMLFWNKGPLDLKSGFRVEQEKYQVTHNLLTSDISSDHKSIHWLPSLNLSWQFDSAWLFRFGLSKNTTRPALDDLTENLSYENETNTLSGFNIALAPYTTNSIDLSLEGYFNDDTLFSVSVYYKKISDFIIPNAQTITLAETQLPNIWDNNQLTPDTEINYITKVNSESASITGIETMFQYEFSYLPYPLNNMGFIGHVTLNDGTMTYYNEVNGEKLFNKPFPSLSKKSGALTLYYEHKNISARLSATYRDSYIYQVNSKTLEDENETGFHATTYIDANFSYALNHKWQVELQGQNLTNEREEQYSDSADRLYNSVTSGRTFYLGLTFQY